MRPPRFVVAAMLLAIPVTSAILAEGGPAVGETAPKRLAQFAPPGPGGRPGPGAPPPPFALFEEGPPASPRAACEGRIHIEAGMRAFLRSRLALEPAQSEGWSRMEAAVAPLDQRARELCARLPGEPSERASAPDRLSLAERQLALRAEMMRALEEPFRSFYETLKPAQRAVLDRIPGPMML